MSRRFERIGEAYGDPLDGPAWDGAALLFCRPAKNEILRYDPTTRAVTRARANTVRTTGLAFGPDGRLYGAQSRSRRVVEYRADGSAYYLNAYLDGRRHNDPHDIAVDQKGRVWFSDRSDAETIPGPVGFPPLDHSSILRLDRSSSGWGLRRMTFDTIAPSGLAFSPDHGTLYVADGEALKAYPVVIEGPLGAPVVLHTFGGVIAGLCTDREGNVVVAGPGPMLHTIAPSGEVLELQPVPGGAATNVTFGGATLFVTTAAGELFAGNAG